MKLEKNKKKIVQTTNTETKHNATEHLLGSQIKEKSKIYVETNENDIIV